MAPPALTPTGRVILGMIAFGRQTGYDIKQFVDQSTRHFWAASYGQIYPEVRDEGMLKLFFSDIGTPDQRVRNIRAMREAHERTLAQLCSLEHNAEQMPEGPRLTLDLGIGLHRRIVEWCEETERRLAAQTAERRETPDPGDRQKPHPASAADA